ncbi:SpoVR family protein [Bordetella pertussis]|nr:SpoVR family protein [Bordetella pertussis]
MNAITGGGELHAVGRAQPISEGSEWTFELIQRYDEAISEIAREYRLDTYPNQIEVITSEQMLDAMPRPGCPSAIRTGRTARSSSATSSTTARACRAWRTRSSSIPAHVLPT